MFLLFGAGAEADHLLAHPLADDVFEAHKSPAADEEDVAGVDLDVLLLGMLAAPLRRDVADGAFEHFQQSLLNAFAGNVAGDADVLAGLGDLVDFIDIDDAALGSFDVEVGGVKQFQKQVFDVFADVAGFGQRGRVADGERHIQNTSERPGEQRFAGAGRADEQDIALIDFDVLMAAFIAEAEAFVVIVDGDAEHLFRSALADHILIELFLDRARRRRVRRDRPGGAATAFFLIDDRLAQFDAFAADVDVARSFDEGADIAVALSAKGAERIPVPPGSAGGGFASAAA